MIAMWDCPERGCIYNREGGNFDHSEAIGVSEKTRDCACWSTGRDRDVKCHRGHSSGYQRHVLRGRPACGNRRRDCCGAIFAVIRPECDRVWTGWNALDQETPVWERRFLMRAGRDLPRYVVVSLFLFHGQYIRWTISRSWW